jgi:tight adherence protein C
MTLVVLQILTSLSVFAAVAMVVYAVFRFPVPAEPPLHRRIATAVGAHRRTVFENPVLAPVMNLGLTVAGRFGFQPLRQRIRQDLEASGNPSGYSVQEYLAVCLISAVGLGVATTVVELVLGGSLLLLAAPLMALVGLGVPLWMVRAAAQRRVGRISKQLPYTLDLISLTMGAGSSFTEAIETLIRDNPEDDLNQELRIVLSEIEFGTARAGALANLAERIPLDSLRSVVGAIIQADRLGTSLAPILKAQADMLRMYRSVRAEKLSASASLRILVPSMLILLAVVIIVFAPLIIRRIQGELL